jgi:hypothetical protein
MDKHRTADACRIGDLVSSFVERLSPLSRQYDSVAQAWEGLVPEGLRSHCRLAGVSRGSLKVLADGSSYLFELQLCKAVLLRELQRVCPAARVHRIEVAMAR